MLVGHGVDLVDIGMVERLLGDPTDQFLLQNFTPREREDVGEGLERPARLAGRFAVKEAVLKALGLGYGAGTSFKNVEVVLAASGQPKVELIGKAAERATSLGISRWLVSTSHEGSIAVASVIALADQDGPR